MSDVLVVQPDAAQADTLRAIFRRVGADLVIVDSTLAAMDAIAMHMPDLILLSALLSPRDEDALIAHLRALDGASHLQTITIPQFRKPGAEAPAKPKGAFGFLKKQKAAPAATGADPGVFADEVIAHLARAREIRSRAALIAYRPPTAAAQIADREGGSIVDRLPDVAQSADEGLGLAHQSAKREGGMGEWRSDDMPIYQPPAYEPVADEPIFANTLVADDTRVVDEAAAAYDAPVAIEDVSGPPPIELTPEPAAVTLDPVALPEAPPREGVSITDEVDRLVRQLGFNLKVLEPDEVVPPPAVGLSPEIRVDTEAIREAAIEEARAAAEQKAREAVAADLARMQAEAEAMRDRAIAEAEAMRDRAIAEARAAAEREAREAVAADLARVQAEAEAMRDQAIAEARAVAEREAREKLEAELARVRSETELTVADALNKVKVEAEEAQRLRAESERQRAEEAERIRAEAERTRAEGERLRIQAQEAFAAELARVRSEVEQSLASQLDTARAESERMRASEAEAVRERAAMEAQLKAELDRLKFVATQARKADENENRKAAEQIKQLEGELARVRQQGEERQAAQLEELRAQMAEMREAAAQQARAAAAEAVASQVARATGREHDPAIRLNVIRMQPRVPQPEPFGYKAAAQEIQEAIAQRAAPDVPEPSAPPADYYSLFQTPEAVEPETVEEPEEEREPIWSRIDYRRLAKWAVPAAACLLLVANTGTAISMVKGLVTPPEKPKLTVQALDIEKPFIEVVEERVGSLKVESTPAGAEAVVDGKSYGATPVTIPDLAVGPHKLELKSRAGTITRRVTIKANQTTLLTEAIYSGWMAIFSPIPVKVIVDGQPVTLTEDSRVMTGPGRHVVEFINEQFNYRTTETIDVRPGETTAHTLTLPMGTVRVSAPDGAEIRVDGQRPSGVPADGIEVSIGAHEISAIHPERGERRVSVDVKLGAPTDVALQYD